MSRWMAAAAASAVAIVVIWAVAELWTGPGRSDGPDAPTETSGEGKAEGAPLVELVGPATLSPDAEIGQRIFDLGCASCHGTNAAGRNGIGPPLVHPVYEPSHHADVAFLMAVRSGVRAHHWDFGGMPPSEVQLTNAEINYVVRYVRELQAANGIQ